MLPNLRALNAVSLHQIRTYSSPIRFRICPTPAQPTSILTRIVFPADQQPILNDQFYVEEMPEEIVIVVKLIYSDRTHST